MDRLMAFVGANPQLKHLVFFRMMLVGGDWAPVLRHIRASMDIETLVFSANTVLDSWCLTTWDGRKMSIAIDLRGMDMAKEGLPFDDDDWVFVVLVDDDGEGFDEVQRQYGTAKALELLVEGYYTSHKSNHQLALDQMETASQNY